jgi:hypothetical protein
MQEKDLYCAIDLHSNNNYVAILDRSNHRVFDKRLKNEMSAVLSALAPFKERITAVAVESTFNWYWLVDGLEDAGYAVRLVNTSAVQQYEAQVQRRSARRVLAGAPDATRHSSNRAHSSARASCSSRSGSQAHAAGSATDGEHPQYSKPAAKERGCAHDHEPDQSSDRKNDRRFGFGPEPGDGPTQHPSHHPGT